MSPVVTEYGAERSEQRKALSVWAYKFTLRRVYVDMGHDTIDAYLCSVFGLEPDDNGKVEGLKSRRNQWS